MADLVRSVSPQSSPPGLGSKPRKDATDGHFRKILDELPAAIYTTDAVGRITYFNEAAATLWGHRPTLGESEWCGSWKLFWPNGTALPHGECPMALTVKEKRAIRGMEAVAERPDGTRVPFIPYPTPLFGSDGIFIGAVNLLVDITDRKRAEEVTQRLAAIVESSDDAIMAKDLEGVITTWNRGAERIFGYTAAEIVGKSVLTLIPDDHRDEEPKILSRIRKGERIEHYETVRRRKDAALLDISLTVSPIRDLNGKIVGASKVARDITGLKRARQQRELIMREMDHRVKNLFALANGVVAISARSATTPKELAHTVGERLGALARAHALTISTASRDGAIAQVTTLHALIGTIVAPYEGKTDRGMPRISISGVDIEIGGEPLTGLALLLHEFTTNAAKYGALSVASGHLEIVTREAGGKILLTWKECGGPPINGDVTSEGFGSILSRMTVSAQLGGEIQRDWLPDGLCIRLSVSRNRLASALA
jgi:PAS domain S-box-containing protein